MINPDRPEDPPPLEEVTPGGSQVYKYSQPVEDDTLSGGDWEGIEAICDHVEKNLGPISTVWHELISPLVHIDVHVVPPTKERPYTFLVTTGMSERPMNVPPGAEAWQYAELMVALPQSWKLDQTAFEDERNYWPVRWLKTLARFPHEYSTWLCDGHTIPAGNPAEPVCEGTQLNGFVLLPPCLAGEKMQSVEITPTQTVNFWSLVPLYQEEMDFKLQKGVEALLKLFDRHGVTDLIDPQRINVVTGRKPNGAAKPWWRRWFSR